MGPCSDLARKVAHPKAGLRTSVEGLQARDQFVVICVGSDEEPEQHITAKAPDCAVIIVDPHRPEIIMRRELLEFEAGVMWILTEQTICLANLPPDGDGQAGQITAEIRTGSRRHN